MSKRITSLLNLVQVISDKTITITNITNKIKACSDITGIQEVKADDFIESVELLNKTIFRDAVDFYFEFVGNNLQIKAGLKNAYMDEYYYIDCQIKDGVSQKELETKLRETIF